MRSTGRGIQTRRVTKERPAAASSAAPDAASAWLRKHSIAVFLALVFIGTARIVSTYGVLSNTSDEPVHIACGMEWLTKGVYQYEAQHPPLARVAAALGPYLTGVPSYGEPSSWQEGVAILFRDHHYDRNIVLARLGILPFFWVASAVVYVWAKRSLGEPGTAFAVLCFTFLPPILAHAGLATTDMALTAMTGASILAALVWIERPSLLHSIVFGAATGLAVLSKFSALPFIPVALAGALLVYFVSVRPAISQVLSVTRRCLLPLGAVVFAGLLTIWGGYRFSFGSVPFTSIHLPAPELYAGIQQVIDHNREGHWAYLLGNHSKTGWWYYFLVVLAVKTPLPFLALLLCGLLSTRGRAKRASWLAFGSAMGIFVFSLFSHINIGVRHILPVYVGFSIAAGAGAAQLLDDARNSAKGAARTSEQLRNCSAPHSVLRECLQKPAAGWALSLLGIWLVATSAFSHPDYLAYFNALAGSQPERVLVDSDLDWGQDVKRLGARLQTAGALQVAFDAYFYSDLNALGFPPVHPFDPMKPSPGWNAVNLTVLKSLRFGLHGDRPEVIFWPEQIPPTEKIGKGIWLWYFPPAGAPAK